MIPRAEVLVEIQIPLDMAVGMATALESFDLEDSDIGGLDSLREFNELLRRVLKLPREVFEDPPDDENVREPIGYDE